MSTIEDHNNRIISLEYQKKLGNATAEELVELRKSVRFIGDSDRPLVVPASQLTVEEWEANCRAAEADIAAKDADAAAERAKHKADSAPPAQTMKVEGMPVRPSKPARSKKS